MKHLLSILLISMSFVGFGQFDLDSLRSDWTDESLPDERRMASMKMLISFGYSKYDLDSTEILALELLDFAVEKNNLNYQAASYSLMGNAHFYIGSYEKATRKC